MNKKTSSKHSFNNLSCEATRDLIEKRKNQELTPHERNVVFEHCVECKECREINTKILEELIEKGEILE